MMFAETLSHFSPGKICDCLMLLFRHRRCPKCGQVHTQESILCEQCLKDIVQKKHQGPDADCTHFHFSRIHYYGLYSGILKELIRDWKFNNRTEFSSAFRPMLASLGKELDDFRPDILVPVPLHPSRLRMRGFNQSLVLAEHVAKSSGIPLAAHGLRRTRKTIPQSALNGTERRENLLQAFSADNARVAGKKVLLVDDVFTTGSTADECARTLLEAGATDVEVMVLARALL
ncbi:ComF family protein [Maridesulfovibrio sp. FT414]|uniref:ComF family protein n=1 Tax=Maridesulfovibrio sp. FT414 TaxID=2979469 RepID=UPI003D80729B